MRSISARQASNASARCGALAAHTIAASPTESSPTRWSAARRVPGSSAAIPEAMRRSSRTAIGA